jgi:hypothetical protein
MVVGGDANNSEEMAAIHPRFRKAGSVCRQLIVVESLLPITLGDFCGLAWTNAQHSRTQKNNNRLVSKRPEASCLP